MIYNDWRDNPEIKGDFTFRSVEVVVGEGGVEDLIIASQYPQFVKIFYTDGNSDWIPMSQILKMTLREELS